ncbi:PASTA domain-containing protein [Streptomyces zhihengii]|uniref:PASTA domain-containing protein n=2 Tax=Streptomyces zhihengii TaxID=1818004 RepID=A0ABS2V3M4_9ACTN|nr:PASTA domain-containing protein [Streptomyces zhihengii]
MVACQPTGTQTPAGGSTASSAKAAASPEADASATSVAATVPNFVGMGLQSAQDTAQEVGFYGLDSHDALGRGRAQALDRNWKVCSQSVAAGTKASTDTRLDFGAVKLEEDCPAKDEVPPSADSGTMPDFTGKSVKAARMALDSGTSIRVSDASADDRMVLVESNWQVCTQVPAAGTALAGRPVMLTAVKFEETCP